ncbi:Scr1 family TA system antitoxin-like transcriptional regulator [Streptomyces sp. NPDC044984]|uniref:Scr1 family TA system antitoxin-like transcriptional regulator n=1 Tax=Streptomyces sp. NPDC044984 TaxID=3154335 RepID=UPI0033D8FFA2
MRETRGGRAAKAKEEGGDDLPRAWSAYGRLLQHLRKRAGLNQQQLGEAIDYSLEQVASVEQGRRPAKAAFTRAADRVLEAGGVLEVLQDEVDRAKLPRFFRNFALIEAEVVSRFSYDPLLVPGLLQTEAYARAVFAGPERRGVCTTHRADGGRDVSVEQVTENVDGLHWFKSSYSGSDGGDCVEVAAGLDVVYVRDSKALCDGTMLRIGRDEWATFVALLAV